MHSTTRTVSLSLGLTIDERLASVVARSWCPAFEAGDYALRPPRLVRVENATIARLPRLGWCGFDDSLRLVPATLRQRYGLTRPIVTLTPQGPVHSLSGEDPGALDASEPTRALLTSRHLTCLDSCLYLGNMHSQFGHDMTEGLARSWALPGFCTGTLSNVTGDGPQLHDRGCPVTVPVLVGHASSTIPRHADILRFLDIPPLRRVDPSSAGHIFRVRELWAPEPGMHLFGRYSETMRRVWQRFAEAATRDRARTARNARRIYLSRENITKRRCTDERDIVTELARHDFTTIYPETLPLPEQIALARECDIMVGIYGSAMHLCQFMRPGSLCIAICHSDFMLPDVAITCQLNGIRCVYIVFYGRGLRFGDFSLAALAGERKWREELGDAIAQYGTTQAPAAERVVSEQAS